MKALQFLPGAFAAAALVVGAAGAANATTFVSTSTIEDGSTATASGFLDITDGIDVSGVIVGSFDWVLPPQNKVVEVTGVFDLVLDLPGVGSLPYSFDGVIFESATVGDQSLPVITLSDVPLPDVQLGAVVLSGLELETVTFDTGTADTGSSGAGAFGPGSFSTTVGGDLASLQLAADVLQTLAGPGVDTLTVNVTGTTSVTAVPVPATAALLGLGLVGIVGTLRRRAA